MKTQSLKTQWLAIQQNPINFEVWQELANIYSGLGLNWHTAYAALQGSRVKPEQASELRYLVQQTQTAGRAENSRVWHSYPEDVLGRSAFEKADEGLKQMQVLAESLTDDWLTLLYLLRLQEMVQPMPALRVMFSDAASIEYLPGETAHIMGRWRLNAGDAEGALQVLQTLVEVTPQRPLRYGSMMLLGEALLRVGNIEGAERAFSRAALSPNPGFLSLLAERSFSLNYWQEAVALRRQVVQMLPNDAMAWLALAQTESQINHSSDALISCEKALQLNPELPDAQLLYAQLKNKTGEGESYFKTVYELYKKADPTSRLASTVAMSSLYAGDLTAQQRIDLHRALCAPVEAAIQPMHGNLDTSVAPYKKLNGRRFRVGYLSGDLHRQHPVNLFLLPVLEHHDKSKFEVFIYHSGNMHDIYTARAKNAASVWHDVNLWPDQDIAKQIAQDDLDLLIDTAGHTSSHRLGVMAMRPAPVQATFLGYPHSTGMTRIDWLIGDSIVSPEEHQHLYSERIAAMPDMVFCWAPVDHYPMPERRPLDANSRIVLGSFNNAMKLVPGCLKLWAEILHQLPNATLLLKASGFADEHIANHFRQSLQDLGIAAERIEMREPTGLFDMMQEYADMDIALDPFPYNGGTTTLQALWMGVPVITLEGENFVGRMGVSFLQALGRPEWIAKTPEEYVSKVVELAQQPELLNQLHENLRQDVQSTRLGDIQTYTENFEKLLLRIAQFDE